MTKKINSQSDFERVKSQFKKASSYREFSKIYHFDPKLRITLTGMSVQEAVPRSKPGSGRRKIFEEMEKNYDGRSISLVNSMTKNVSKDATKDGDIFIAVYKGFVRLSEP